MQCNQDCVICTNQLVDGGINGELRTMPEGQNVAHDLNAPGILHGCIGIHVSQANVPLVAARRCMRAHIVSSQGHTGIALLRLFG